MNSESLKRLHGLAQLVGDAVEQGTSAIERVHLGTANRTFQVLEHIPPIATGSRVVHTVHDTIVTGTYGSVRWVTRGVRRALDVAFDAATDAEE